MAGAKLKFEIQKNKVVFEDINTGEESSYPLEGFSVNNSGNEELSGKDVKASYNILVSLMETAVSLTVRIDAETDRIETSLDSRLCL